MNLRLTTVGPVLAALADEVTPDQQNAFSLGLCWAEAVARKTSTDVASAAYFTALSAELGRIAWIVTDAGTDSYTASGGVTNPAQAVTEIAGQYMPASQVIPLTSALQNIASEDPDARLAGFMTTWWDNLDQSLTSSIFATCPLSLNRNGQLTTTLCFTDFSTARMDWQSFFVSRVTSKTAIQVRHIKISLNQALWNQIEAEIANKLGDAAKRAIQNIDIDL